MPILWVQVDPDYQWIRELKMEQSDTTWMNVLKYERDAMAQLNALEALEEFPSVQVRDSFKETILTGCFYYQVRLQAAHKLAKVTYQLTLISQDWFTPEIIKAVHIVCYLINHSLKFLFLNSSLFFSQGNPNNIMY